MEYLCSDIFMVRVPALSLKTFFEFSTSKCNIIDYISKDIYLNNFIEESLLISSRSLYQSLKNPSTSEKKIRNLNSGILNYMIRASTRPTPFGLLAGVGLGEFSNQTEIVMNQKEYIKDVKIDTQWMAHVIHEFESDINVVSQLKVKFNPICYLWGKRLKNPYFSNHGAPKEDKEKVEENDIQYTGLIELIRGKTEKFIPFLEIKNIIKAAYKDAPEELINRTLLQLIENEYLITNLRIPAYCDNALGHVINELKDNEHVSELVDKLKEIEMLLEQYCKVENKSKMIEMIYDKMQSIYKSKNYLEVNKGLILNKNCLADKIKKELEHFVNCLTNISMNATEYSKLNKFKEAFSEKFGLNVEVPLIDVIDKNGFNGLELLENSNETITEREKKIKKIIDNKIILALMNGSKEVNLYNEDFSTISNKKKNIKAPKSFDMSFYITRNDKGLNGKDYNIIVGPNAGSNKAGSMFQRFYDAFNKQLITRYNEIYSKEIELTKNDYLILEVREMSVNGRVNNIINRYKNHEYYLAIACTDETVPEEIHINDLCIGLSQERELYIKSISKKKKCKVVMDNMLVSRLNSKMISFLRTISDEYEDKVINRIFNLYKNEYIYTPRIKFENIIIHPRSWNFSIEDFNVKSFETFKKSFDKVIHTYKIDEYVYLCEGDNRLLIDLKLEESLRFIYSSVRNNDKLNLCETEILREPIVKDLEEDYYISEFVFSFIQHETNNELMLQNMKYDFVQDNRIFQNKNNRFPLGDDGWIYMKLYGVGNKENELLTKELLSLLNELDAQKFFFIRYSDSGKHLRLRFKFENESIALNKLHRINSWIFELQKNCLVNRNVFDVYERETNRYGGLELIEHAEQLFYADSIFVINMLNLFDLENEKDRELAYMVGMISILKELTHDEKELFQILDEENLRNQYKDEFRKSRSNYLRITECIFKRELKEIDGRLLDVMDAYKKRQVTLYDFKSELEKQIQNKKITNTKKNIVLSVTHMYCNRMTGIIEYEGKYLSIIRHSLYALIEKWKHTNRK